MREKRREFLEDLGSEDKLLEKLDKCVTKKLVPILYEKKFMQLTQTYKRIQ